MVNEPGGRVKVNQDPSAKYRGVIYEPRWASFCGAQFFLAAFPFALANGEGAFPALIKAHRLRAAAAIFFRPAALIVRFGAMGAGIDDAAVDDLDPGGRPRRFVGPCRA
jgi:hypothetical protein